MKCPDGIYIKRDFRWYEVLSRLMLDVVRDFSPQVEHYSIDEFFFEATPPRGLDVERYAVPVRQAKVEQDPGERRIDRCKSARERSS